MANDSSKVARSFLKDWAKHHKDRQPMGWVLRQDAALPWVRFHALPASKRYADTDDEMATILARGNCLASETLGDDRECWLICARWDDIDGPGELVGNWREDYNDPACADWRFFVRREEWSKGKYDEDLMEVAEDAPYYLVWFDAKSGRIFAPYDGGFDLFVCSIEEVADLKCRHQDWLSDREDGL